MANFVRQTGYSREELFETFSKGEQGNFCCGKDSPGRGVPIGLVVNEIGVIFHTTDPDDEEHGTVEKFLTDLISNKAQYVGNRATAYFYLKHPNAVFVRKESQVLVDAYEHDPENSFSVERVLNTLQNAMA